MFPVDSSTLLLYGLFVVLGLVFGSFANVVLARMPNGESLFGRSRCPHCRKEIGIGELVPVVSYLFLLGKCSKCRKRISPQYPLMELWGAFIFAVSLWLVYTNPLAGFMLGVALLTLTVISLIDHKTKLIPDALTALLAASSIAFQLSMYGSFLIDGAVLAGLFLGAQWLLSRGKWVGSGDVLLAGSLGLLVGSWQMAAIMLMVTYIVGSAIVLLLMLVHILDRKTPIAFGPLLALGAVITLLFGALLEPVLLPF